MHIADCMNLYSFSHSNLNTIKSCGLSLWPAWQTGRPITHSVLQEQLDNCDCIIRIQFHLQVEKINDWVRQAHGPVDLLCVDNGHVSYGPLLDSPAATSGQVQVYGVSPILYLPRTACKDQQGHFDLEVNTGQLPHTEGLLDQQWPRVCQPCPLWFYQWRHCLLPGTCCT